MRNSGGEKASKFSRLQFSKVEKILNPNCKRKQNSRTSFPFWIINVSFQCLCICVGPLAPPRRGERGTPHLGAQGIIGLQIQTLRGMTFASALRKQFAAKWLLGGMRIFWGTSFSDCQGCETTAFSGFRRGGYGDTWFPLFHVCMHVYGIHSLLGCLPGKPPPTSKPSHQQTPPRADQRNLDL